MAGPFELRDRPPEAGGHEYPEGPEGARLAAFEAGEEEQAAPASVLDELVADIEEEVGPPPVVLDVPLRPGYAVRCSARIDQREELRKWARQATNRKARADDVDAFDFLRFYALALIHKCQAIVRHGADVADEGGPMTFLSDALHRAYKARNAEEVVRRFFGSDGHVLQAGHELLTAAGYGPNLRLLEGDEVDPTIAS